jgi:hypothetical protein
MVFSEVSPKIRNISPSAVKITYGSKHAVWVETDLFMYKLVENGRVIRNERAQMAFSAKRGRAKAMTFIYKNMYNTT